MSETKTNQEKEPQPTEKRYFLIKNVNCSAGVNPIWGITDNEEYAKSVRGVFCDYEEVKFINLKEWRISKINEIAPHYHDRLCMSMLKMSGQKCKCCGQEVLTTTSIEHDSQDFSKDLSICFDCYTEIVNWWKKNKPGKIAAI